MGLRGAVRKFNDSFAVRATVVFGTMGAFYLFFGYGLLPVLFPAATVTLLYWSNVVQLIALPLLAVGQRLQGKGAEKQAQETHDAVMEELRDVQEGLADLRELVAALHDGKIEFSQTPASGS